MSSSPRSSFYTQQLYKTDNMQCGLLYLRGDKISDQEPRVHSVRYRVLIGVVAVVAIVAQHNVHRNAAVFLPEPDVMQRQLRAHFTAAKSVLPPWNKSLRRDPQPLRHAVRCHLMGLGTLLLCQHL